MIRGIEKKVIFRDDTDRDRFVERLDQVLTDTATPCYAWALLKNHVHLLVMTGVSPIATVMRRLLTGYAQDFNRRHDRHGQLFQNRYRSILCERDPYLLELVRYIHLNPLRAGLVQDADELQRYPYCGHGAVMGIFACPWHNTQEVLGLFAATAKEARRKYSAFIEEGIQRGRRPELVGGGLIRSAGGWESLKHRRRQNARIKGDERILGNSAFVDAVLKTAGEELQRKSRLRAAKDGFGMLLSRVAAYYAIDAADIRSGSRQRAVAKCRSVLCYLAVRVMHMSCISVARELGFSTSAVSNAVLRGAAIVREEPGLKQKLVDPIC